jgi:Mg-chelatase subunit ChlD
VSPEVGVLDENAFDNAFAEDPDATVAMLVDMGSATDERLRATARALAGKIVLDAGRRGVPGASGVGKLRRVPAEYGGELDLDASLPSLLDARAARRTPSVDDLVARTWGRPELALCLLVDTSGSMTGARLAAAALTAGACSWRAPSDYAVLSFSREVRVLRSMHSHLRPAGVVDSVLALQGHGVTALGTALRAACDQLEQSTAARRVVVLLSDCRATDEEDPLPSARRVPELLVLAPAEDCDQAAQFASSAGARWAPLSGAAAAPTALATLLGDNR